MATQAKRALSSGEREEAIALLRAGITQREVAKRFGVSQATIARAAKFGNVVILPGVDSETEVTNYDSEARLQLLFKALDRVDGMIAQTDKPQGLRELAVTIGVLIDKVRLELGDVTSREEHVTNTNARERVAARLEQLAQRRVLVDRVSSGDVV